MLWRSSWIDVGPLLCCSRLAVGADADADIVGAGAGILARLGMVRGGRLRGVDVGSGPSADKFDKIPAISIGLSMSIPISAPMLMSMFMSGPVFVFEFMFEPGSGSTSKGDEVEVDPEYSVGVELGAEVAAVARELEAEPEPELDPASNPDANAEPGPRGKPCILASPSTSFLSEEEPTAEDCDCRRSGIQGRWGDIVKSSDRRVQGSSGIVSEL